MAIPSRPFSQVVLSTRCARFRVMNYGLCLVPLFCSVTTHWKARTCGLPHVVMWVCLCSTMVNHLYAHAMDTLGSVIFFPSATAAHVLFCELLYSRASEKKNNWCAGDIIRTKIQSANEYEKKKGGEGVWMKNAYESKFKWLFIHACVNKHWNVNMWSS